MRVVFVFIAMLFGMSPEPDMSSLREMANDTPAVSREQSLVIREQVPMAPKTVSVSSQARPSISSVPAVIGEQAATATERAVRLDPPIPYDGYRLFDDCRQAVDYLFAGRPDYERAHMVVHRESRYVPTAVSPTGARGCTQITSGIRNAFLQGAWDDPYWNVLAMRDAVDHPEWGWCHWDVVNYCRAGGDF
jgi:soluble lytic murein transglycosylase-like protein